MRLIDADAIMSVMQKKFDMQDLYLPVHFQKFIIDEMPTVEIHPNVLCFECKYYSKHDVFGREIGFCNRGKLYDPRMYFSVPENGYCNFGKTKEECDNA